MALGWLVKADKSNTIEEHCQEMKFSKNTKLVFSKSPELFNAKNMYQLKKLLL